MVAYCGWDPTVQITETINLDGNGTSLLTLPSLNVTDVSAVTLTNSDGTTLAATIGPSAQVGWKSNGELWWNPISSQPASGPFYYRYWPFGQQNIVVTYTGGYTGAPEDLDAALNSVSKRMPQLQSGRTSAKLDTAAFTYAANVAAGGFLTVEQWIFDKYRIIKVA